MGKKQNPRDVQVRHRLSGAALLGVREPTPPTMAIDAAPRAGDVACDPGRPRMISCGPSSITIGGVPFPVANLAVKDE